VSTAPNVFMDSCSRERVVPKDFTRFAAAMPRANISPELAWALTCAPELASDMWLREAGHAPRATQDAIGYARSCLRRDQRAGGSRGVRCLSLDAKEWEPAGSAPDPLTLLELTEAAAEAGLVDQDVGDAGPVTSRLSTRRLQQLAERRQRALEAGQGSFPGLGFAAAA